MTPQEILDDAYPRVKALQPGKILDEATEGLRLVNRVIRMFFQIGTRVNPWYYAKSASVLYGAPGWARPSDAEAVLRIEFAGDECAVVARDQLDVLTGKPTLWRMGQVYRSAGNAGDPTNEALDFFYSKRPTDAADLATAIDPMWPAAYLELASLECAAYMCVKDRLREDLPKIVADRDAWLRLYLMFLEHETLNEERAWGQVQPFTSGSVVPLSALLAGGSSVVLPNAA